MAQITGTDAVIGIYHETTSGADPTTPAGRKVYAQTFGLQKQQNLLDDPTIRGGRGVAAPGLGNSTYSGTIVATLAPENLCTWLYHVIAAPTTTGAGPYEHTFVPGAMVPGAVLEVDWTGVLASTLDKFNGCRVATAAWAFPQEGPQTLTMNWNALSRTIGTATIDDAGGLDDPGHNGVFGTDGIIKVEGSQVGGITDFAINVDNEVDTSIYTFPASGGTAGDPHSLPYGRALITGSFTAIFDTVNGNDFIDLAEAKTDVQIEVVHTIGTGAGTAGNELISHLIDHCYLEPTSIPIDTPRGLKATYNFRAFATGSDLGLVVTIDNAVAAAAI